VDLPLPTGLEGQATEDDTEFTSMYTQNATNTAKKLEEMRRREELKKRERMAAGGGEIQALKKQKIKEEA
jgi:ERCC4-type nuclease